MHEDCSLFWLSEVPVVTIRHCSHSWSVITLLASMLSLQAQALAQERFERQYVTFRGKEAVAKGAVVALAAFVGASLLIDVRLLSSGCSIRA